MLKRFVMLVCVLYLSCGDEINLPVNITKTNQTPDEPTLIAPNNMTTIEKLSIKIEWDCEDPDSDNLTYDVYLGRGTTNKEIIKKGIKEKVVLLENLEPGLGYCWKIIAFDKQDSSVGSTWFFRTQNGIDSGLIGEWSGKWKDFWIETISFSTNRYSKIMDKSICDGCNIRVSEKEVGTWYTFQNKIILKSESVSDTWFSYTEIGRIVDSTRSYTPKNDTIEYILNVPEKRLEIWDNNLSRYYYLNKI